MVETLGTACPAANSRRFPAALGWVTTRFTETAFAVDGMPQLPATARTRVCWPWRTGPPMGAPPRVSTTRHGTRVKKFTAGEASVSVAELLARFGSVTVADAVIVAV